MDSIFDIICDGRVRNCLFVSGLLGWVADQGRSEVYRTGNVDKKVFKPFD